MTLRLTAAEWLTDRASRGTYHFTTEEAQAALGSSAPAVRAALRRLKARGEIAVPYRGFHVVVPLEYRRLGCLPPDQFIPQLMEWLREPYYVGLLSAAEYHGAAHQRPQVFQVVVPKNRPDIECGRVHVRFVARKGVEHVPVESRNTPRGTVSISTPEATALDLVGYTDHGGGFDNVATVIAELAERIDGGKLAQAAEAAPVAWAQRLGLVLERVEAGERASQLLAFVQEHAKAHVPLVPGVPKKGAPRDHRWKLIVNADVEAEL